MKQLQFHKLADLFPMMEGDAFAAFAADIKERGLLHPIVVHDDKILDGRNRYRACLKADVAIRVETFAGDDPLGFVIASNLHRRHLDESQRSMVAAKLETMKHGDNQHTQGDANLHVLRVDAAHMLNVSPRTVAAAATVRAKGTHALVQAVEQGAIPVSVAAKVATLPKDQQREAVLAPDRAKHMVKRSAREERERGLAEATAEASRALGANRYGVIYADPPWRFKPYSEETGSDRAADNHYPTLTINDIADIEPPAATNCVLFLWVTVPMLALGIKLMERWGFAYKTACAWHKPAIGTGYWFRNTLELLLVGTRGDVPAPAMGDQPPQVQTIERGRHSEKPDAFADMIAAMFPNTPKLEMFARCARDGWDAWGNQLS
jgi:N6-adenosine-specific RNA methylase IME4